MRNNLEILKEYYSDEHTNKIFCTKLCVQGKSFDILYDYDKKDEIEKYVSSFSEYLPYYVYNADTLECIDPTCSIAEKLRAISRRCWNGPTVPDRDAKVNGIFGEVFLDFYERIVKNERLASTYASRRDFNSRGENKGYDNVLFVVKGDTVELVFAEAKFVASKSSATSELVTDIKGVPNNGGGTEKAGHLTREYMNQYITFIVEKNTFFSEDDKKVLKPFFHELNNVLINENGDFISFLIDRDIRVNCVFFAIFHNKNTDPAIFLDAYDMIEVEAQEHLEAIGFTNYGIEIVFIPTEAKSMEIKGAIDEYYTRI